MQLKHMKHLSNTTKKNIISRIITGHNSRMITVRYFKRKHDMYMYFIHLNVILTYYLNWGSEALNCVDKPNSRIVSSDSNLGKMNGEGGDSMGTTSEEDHPRIIWT